MTDDIHIEVNDPEREWKCTECGHELTQSDRPGYCPDCNCTDGDMAPGTWLFVPKSAHWDGT